EIDELRLMDDLNAANLYGRALAETPNDELIADRLVRVLARRVVTTAGGPGARGFEMPAFAEILSMLAKRADTATTSEQSLAFSFQFASLLVVSNRELSRARGLLDKILDTDPRHVGALRLSEAIARRGPNSAAQPIAQILKQQGDSFSDLRARI